MRAFTKPQLKRLAARQQYTIIGIVFILIFYLTWFIVRSRDGDESVLNMLETCMLIAVIVAGLNSILLMFSAYGLIGGILVGALFWYAVYSFPAIAVLLLLGINQYATVILRRHGAKVGFLGAEKKQFESN